MPAGFATKAQETSGQNSAVEEGTEFPLDESGDWAVTILLPCEESFELFGDDTVQHAFFGMMRGVFNRGCQHAQPAGRSQANLK